MKKVYVLNYSSIPLSDEVLYLLYVQKMCFQSFCCAI